MKNKLGFLLLLLFISLFTGIQQSEAYQVKTDHAEVKLISEQSAIVPGETFWIGIEMDIQEGWYVYYRNPADSGMPLTVEWTHEEDFNISDIKWPYPQWKDAPGGLTSYAYEDSMLYMMEATAPEGLDPGDKTTLQVAADWLICEMVCIPENADLELTLDVAEEPTFNEEHLTLFSQMREKLPADLDFWESFAEVNGDTITLKLTTDAFELPQYENVIYFSNEKGEIENGADQPYTVENDTLTMKLQKSVYKPDAVNRVWGLVYNEEGWDESGRTKAMTVDINLGGEESIASTATDPVLSQSFLLILGFAFLGGMILNLMPCVFPILSIKVMNFLQVSGDNPKKAKIHGWVFGAGVLVSFLILAGSLLLLRAGGQELGWGFQLQSPPFIAFLTFLMFGLGLNLMGVFEIGNSLMNVAGSAQTGEGLKGSFFSGVLATVLATPCTAPFMGTALGAAITMPALSALLVFAVLGFGMAAPYILLSSFPALMKKLPKPGAWMETFKQFMAFPLFATAIWLAWVFGQQVGIDGLTNLLIGLLLLSMGIWILNRWKATQISNVSRIVSRAFVILLVTGGFFISASSNTKQQTSGTTSAQTDQYGIEWQSYTEAKLEQHLAENRNVFLDFTAAWCITCKANERVVFSSEDVKEKFRDLDFVMMKADWTNRNPEITRALESFGRNGVPLYVIYNEDLEEPMILPELLTPGIVMDALDDLPQDNQSLSMKDS
ncbi:protein-disulfide reductase DsbD family protein [Rhodohalobacter sulfatireducens]|uniref:Thioredoxin family protein n=1 Tax=Rhodohalobacter sulfatireducens TaxID=2911366 RepID=A0ABS9KBD9_9BACT|nr:thioredoxin family protein [Rhodohalobacter sulfatireducens]MCG2588175.1 thioredoxin family protein [Rhodohalobacter sulfatireducens]